MIDSAEFERKQRALLNGEDEEKKDFIEKFSPCCKDDFASVFDDWKLPSVTGFKPPASQWREGIFAKPPWSSCCDLVKSLTPFKPSDLCHPPKWFAIHVECVSRGFLDRSFFAYHKASNPDGKRSIAEALTGKGKKVDDCLRDILRHMGGIVIRYTRSVYLDCPTAATYWRHYMVQETKKHDFAKGVAEKDIYRCLGESAVWRQLIESATTRKTIIGETHIRAAFIAFMIDGIKKMKSAEDSEAKAKRVKNIIDRIADLNQRQHLGFYQPDKIVEIFKEDAQIKKHV